MHTLHDHAPSRPARSSPPNNTEYNLSHPHPPTSLHPWGGSHLTASAFNRDKTALLWQHYLPLGPLPDKIRRSPDFGPPPKPPGTVPDRHWVEDNRLPRLDLRFLHSLGRWSGRMVYEEVGHWDGRKEFEGETWGFYLYRGNVLGGGGGSTASRCKGKGDKQAKINQEGKGVIKGKGKGKGKEEEHHDEAVERFKWGVWLLMVWTRFYVRQSRYEGEDAVTWQRYPHFMPQPVEANPDVHRDFGGDDATDALAKRFWCQMVEDYRGGMVKEQDGDHVSGSLKDLELEGGGEKKVEGSKPEPRLENDPKEHHLAPIGRAFAKYIRTLTDPARGDDAVDLYYRNTRYDHCIVLDDAALESLEQLPARTPGIKPRTTPQDRHEVEAFDATGWVWLLDRETMERWDRDSSQGKIPRGPPPWIRLRISKLPWLWFRRPQRQSPASWEECCEEDSHDPKVFWWNDEAARVNEERGTGRQGRENNQVRSEEVG